MKFKGIKKKIYKKKSPSNSRSITEKAKFFSLSRFFLITLKILVAFAFVATAIVVALDLQNNLQQKKQIDLQRMSLNKELIFWQNFITKNDNYRDAYFQAAISEYKLGENGKARDYLQKGLNIDPNSEIGKKIDKLLK